MWKVPAPATTSREGPVERSVREQRAHEKDKVVEYQVGSEHSPSFISDDDALIDKNAVIIKYTSEKSYGSIVLDSLKAFG